jgi:hypothetical protein
MGMFDYVKCLYPLPDNIPDDEAFQTKDLTNVLADYTITTDGHLKENSGNEDLSHFTGKIEMYWSNVVASGPGLYTRDGEDAHFLEYAVTFVDGTVARVDQLKNDYEPALERSKFPTWQLPSEEEKRRTAERENEHLTGRRMWVWWGGQESGYPVKVVAENSRELVVQRDDERFEIVPRSSRDRTLFDTYEDGKRYKDERKAEWDRQQQEYEQAIRTRAAARKSPDTAPSRSDN